MRSANTSAVPAAIMPSMNVTWYPLIVGNPDALPALEDASTAPITAAAVPVPSDLHSAFKPFEAPVSL